MKTYLALAFRGVSDGPLVVMFAAPATEIDAWSGVPQRERFDDNHETIGFQREENQKRLDQLSLFFRDPRNVAQNPLLCAQRSEAFVRFIPDDASGETDVQIGVVEIDDEDLSSIPLNELLLRLLSVLESRQPTLQHATPSAERQSKLQERLRNELGHLPVESNADDEATDVLEESSIEGLFSSETHVVEFWQEVKLRSILIETLDPSTKQDIVDGDSFLGFERDALISYLKPVFLVDGQHRLQGAVRAAADQAADAMKSGEVETRIESGEDPEVVAEELIEQYSRKLPVALLMDTNVEEHVFQFVVVNQKATPVGKALLGTIVATSLTDAELQGVQDRLEQVRIDVKDSQAVAWFTRSPESAFRGLVQQGIEDEEGGKLPWTVLRDMLAVFRTLKGGRLYHSPRIDYADKWRRNQLLSSDYVRAVYDSMDDAENIITAMELWSAVDGPWRGVANAFFTEVRDILGDPGNLEAGNGWGRLSNLYNKVSLNILIGDFFQWLTDRGETINSDDNCSKLVREWLSDVDRAYFNRDWKLEGVKRDSTGIRSQWAEVWVDYRKDPTRLPSVTQYRKARSS